MSTLKPNIGFAHRHIGTYNNNATDALLRKVGVDSMERLIEKTVPRQIRSEKALAITSAMTEFEYLQHIKTIAQKNTVNKSYIGLGYHGTITPSPILRNIFENPGWYTQYTPYQAEIAQGRLEALLNFQTVVSDLTGMPIANASLLDEGTAAAEAMAMFFGVRNKKVKGAPISKFFVSNQILPQSLDILMTRAEPIGIELVVGDWKTATIDETYFGALLQYPGKNGLVEDYSDFTTHCKSQQVYVTVAADLLALTLLKAPGQWGADAVVGNTQRFGVPMGYGGPHAAYFATTEKYKRQLPGRIIGASIDALGNPALRMALQTREQHIKRDKATSNICTAQALLAIMAGMYAVYHGAEGLKAIAERVHLSAKVLAKVLGDSGFKNENATYFDTLLIAVGDQQATIYNNALKSGINLRKEGDTHIAIALDETINIADLQAIIQVFDAKASQDLEQMASDLSTDFPNNIARTTDYLSHEVFQSYRTETKLMRYIKQLENKDLSLTHSMIALGSCTMKLNAATELIPVSWPEFANIHPFAPKDQAAGYYELFEELEKDLCEVTGFAACSLQPNSGAQGEYTGLLTIRAYHEANGDTHRNIALIPSSAHGTNPASAVMAGMKVVVVKCDEEGNIDMEDLQVKTAEHSENLSCLMVTYPSTHGVFEETIIEMCALIHNNGGKVYMDGANMNAQVGITSPGIIGADVCHLNLHKTFAIPHGGGGPGMGPICVNESLKPYLPKHALVETGGDKGIHAVSAAPYGSASILLISYAYIKLLGAKGLTRATEYAILNANYIRVRLQEAYEVLYLGKEGFCAHELILDLRPFKTLVSAEDVAKRLIDYGFHAPTLSFPVAGTIMIEPTESESLDELDRFCDAMLAIKKEIDAIANGDADPKNNVLANAPHTQLQLTADEWDFPYSRSEAAYPLDYLKTGSKFWASVARVNNAHGDRNLVCTCLPISAYE